MYKRNLDEFRIVEKVSDIPASYMIWNIGKNMEDGYLPFCRLSDVQPFPGGRSIDTDSLIAIKCDGAAEILAAASWGPKTSKEMEKFIAKNANKQKYSWICERMEKAIPYMEKIGL